MIYFDKNKQAYAFEIDNPIATIDDDTWAQYAGKDTWDIVDSKFTDISGTQEYKAEQKIKQFQQSIQYQHDAFNEYAREIVFQIQYNTALSNTTLILNLEEQLQAEQQAVIARINAITEAYNNENNQQST